MSGYTIGEIAVWLLLATTLGFVLGWLLREIKCRAIHGAQATAVAPTVLVPPVIAKPAAGVRPVVRTFATKAAAKKAEATATAPAVERGTFMGSAKPLAGGAAPSAEYTIKGNSSSMIYHTPESPSYERMVAKTWFTTEADAEAAGFRKPRNA